jgi:protein-S-isoprenylcysteine O-methyltransferase Ste14
VLVTTGPYRFVRHSIYSSMILMLIGTILFYGSWFVCIVSSAAATAVILRVKQEEAIMIKLFGDKYTHYMKGTKRLIPLVY